MYIADDNVRPEVIKRISSFFTTARKLGSSRVARWMSHDARCFEDKTKRNKKKKEKKEGKKKETKERKIVVNRVIWFINDNERAEG